MNKRRDCLLLFTVCLITCLSLCLVERQCVCMCDLNVMGCVVGGGRGAGGSGVSVVQRGGGGAAG